MDGYYSRGGFDPTVAVHRAFPLGHAFFASVVILDSDLYMYAYIPAGGGHGADYDSEAYRGGGFGAVPAAEEEIARLEEAAAAAGETIAEAACAVCLESFEEGGGGSKIRKMPCSHGFHEGCIFQWLRISRLCPCCRFALPAAADDDELSDSEPSDQV